MKEKAKVWFTLLRPFATPWVVSNFLLGGAYAGLSMENLPPLLIAAFGMILVIFGAHMFNAYYDYAVLGLDKLEKGSKAKAYTAASQVLPAGKEDPKRVLWASIILWILGSIIYIPLSTNRPSLLFPLGLGLFCATCYSVYFKVKGFGEIPLFLGHGVASTTAGYIAVAGVLSLNALLVSFITGLWAALAYGIDQWKDVRTDLIRRVKTLAARLDGYNMKVSNYLQLGYFTILFYHIVLVQSEVLPATSMLSMLTFLPMFASIVVIDRNHDQGSILTLVAMISYPILMILGFFFT